jgi:hypothetical protein
LEYSNLKLEGSPNAVVKLLPCDHKVMGKSWKQHLAKMHRKVGYIRHRVVGPFSGPYTSGSYVHWSALFYSNLKLEPAKKIYNSSFT